MSSLEPISLVEMSPAELTDNWENLNSKTYHKTSDETIKYNCVSWALNKQDRWRDFFYAQDGSIDPDQSPKKYIILFEKHGFSKCGNHLKEVGYEKIAVYQDNYGNFSHVARQLENNNWTSKMGEFEDIEHYSLDAVSGKCYGQPVIFMKRKL